MIPLVLLALDKIVGHYLWLLKSGRGLPQSEDSQWYINYANALMNDFTIGFHMNDLLYFGYNILLTLLLALFKDPVTVIFVQAVTASLSVILVYQIARMLFNRTTAIIASYFYYDTYAITLWAMYILSDSFFITVLLLCVYFLLLSMETNKRIYRILFMVTSLYMLVFRPAGIVAFCFIMLYVAVMYRTTVTAFIKKHRFAVGGSAAAVLGACVFMYSAGKLTPLITSLQFNAKMVLYNVYAKGWVYDRSTPQDYFFKPDYTVNICNSLILSFIINNWDHVLVLYGKRVIAFFGKWVWQTDLTSIRGILRFADHLLPSLLFAAGTIAALVNRSFKKASIVWLVILAVFIFCILLFIDGMYRYRAPAIPFIAIAAAYGAERIIRVAVSLTKKYAEKLIRYGKRKIMDRDPGISG
ncbi:MAG: hypothetical protein K0S39_821 [Paenibacillus sp.]|jgi:4-amino-4-deoxy-L-arabinose transferase-like glycosyltransferase|nr:hypothetical protein [Paenibacillus sp.]